MKFLNIVCCISFIAEIVATSPASAQSIPTTDSGNPLSHIVTFSNNRHIRATSFILPASLIAFGALTINTGHLGGINVALQDAIWDDNPHRTFFIETYGQWVPAVAVYSLNAAGLRGKNRLVDRTLIYAISNAVANGISFGIKDLKIERRPDGSNDYSFPSGHTTEAFVSAEFLRQEYKDVSPYICIAGYAVAVGSGYMRMSNNKHWFCDVMAGAGIGMGATRFAYYIYPVVKRALFPKGSGKRSTVILPTYQNGAYGFSAICHL